MNHEWTALVVIAANILIELLKMFVRIYNNNKESIKISS